MSIHPQANHACTIRFVGLSVLFAVVLGIANSVYGQSQVELSAKDVQFFESKVRPLLIKHCYGCHSSDEGNRIRGGLVLDSLEGWKVGGISGPAVIPGDVEGSLLIEAIRGDDPDFLMPPNKRLDASDVAIFEEWIRRGAPDPRILVPLTPGENGSHIIPGGGVPKEAGADHWAFQPIAAQSVPEVEDDRWVNGAIDSFILSRLEAEGLKPSGSATKAALIRRLSFDLRGYQPTPDEIHEFVTDRSPEAYPTLVDRFLASVAYGERWGRHWLDVARFAESSGKEQDVPYPHAWRYRNWVIDAFNQDLPYDDFIRMQIAGDLLKGRTRGEVNQNLVATGYLAIGPKSHRERQRKQFELDVADEQMDAITQGMLGLTVACARCHDHKYDPISQQDYYQLAGVLLSSDTLFGGSGNIRGMQSDLLNLSNMDDSMPHGIDIPVGLYQRLDKQRSKLAKEIAQLEAQSEGRGNTPGDIRQKLRTNRIRLAPVEDVLARFNPDGTPNPANKVAMGIREDATPADARLLVRGELDNPADVVPRGIPPIAHLEEPILIREGSGRREFAEWVASVDNPLTARVMVNRIWLHLFGRGIVTTTENFGLEGIPPTHPELLDHLSRQFIDQEWSVKKLIREIVLSSAYQMSSDDNPRGVKTDPENTLYWRMTPSRLEGEAIRDAILVASGELDSETQHGSPVSWLAGRTVDPSVVDSALYSTKRSVYLPQMRSASAVILQTFDGPEPSFVTGDRDETNVPSQALLMLNSEWVTRQSDEMAAMLLRLDVNDRKRQEIAFLRTLGRKPSSSEKIAIRRFFTDFGSLLNEGQATESLQKLMLKDRSRRRIAQRRGLDPMPPSVLVHPDLTQQERLNLLAWSSFCQSLFASAEFRYLN
jgi:hypothetical protein